jgi:CheY-like chemotaxis protein
MARAHLIHWNREQAGRNEARLSASGYDVAAWPVEGPAELRILRDDPPDLFVIDLSRSPSKGRDIALAVRSYKDTRRVPLVFVAGDEETIAQVRALLPDAEYATWPAIRGALRRALARPMTAPVVPSRLAGYAGAPLAKKLGIKRSMTVGLVGAPAGFAETILLLPERPAVRRGARGTCDLVIWFPASQRALEMQVKRIGLRPDGAGLWIAWAKQASGVSGDLNQIVVRRIGLAAGLVDYKICSIDKTWSALRFRRRA